MNESLNLPKFEIPDLREKRLTPAAIQRWMVQNFRLMRANGVVDRMVNAPGRCPADARFTP